MSTSEKKRHKRLAAMRDEDIDYSDIPETDEGFWKDARIVSPPGKERITIRLDEDVLDFFRREGEGYQTRINDVLRSYVRAKTAAR
jgi:uncharacterized protein (DUF4415 family)